MSKLLVVLLFTLWLQPL